MEVLKSDEKCCFMRLSDISRSRMASKLCGCNGSWSLALLAAQPGDCRDGQSEPHWGDLDRVES